MTDIKFSLIDLNGAAEPVKKFRLRPKKETKKRKKRDGGIIS